MIASPLTARRRLFLVVLPIIALIAAGSWFIFRDNGNTDPEGLPDVVDYNYHIRPILSDRCYKCHGPDGNKREADLRLDTEEGAYKALKDDPKGHVIVAGDPLNSDLYLRLVSTDTSYLMPPPSSNLALTPYEIKLIEKWITQGAKYKKHWAFIVPAKPSLPEVAKSSWPKNEIDRFTLAAMEKKGYKPSDEADKERLLKRVAIDITGLPPTVDLQEKFLKDETPDAYEKMVDELLKSKHYGEKMAADWLDVARYADSHGYQDDGLRTMWPWRDWVIHAFNQNYSYKKFVQWQLAGDIMDSTNLEMVLATGFNRNHKITQEGGVIPEEYRTEYVTDRTNGFGKAFLALTFECSKCHDHKYDPISQKDYFGTFAFFNQVDEKGFVGDIGLASLGDPPNIKITTKQVDSVLTFINKKDTGAVTVMVMKDTAARRVTRVLKRGAYDQPADTVNFALPAAILPFDSTKFQTNRLGLAEWLFSKDNPLTARVYVNRVWQQFFGRGIVKTAGDFGMQGELPTHPELLDWLAVDFMENGWDIKRLVKQIVTSATYRQSAEVNERKLATDPENIWLSRYSRKRLTAEEQRDLVLATSGLLVPEIGGPSVKPYQPKGIWESSTSGRGQLAKYVQDHGDSLYRRTVYTFIKRTVPPPALLVFDASNRDQCEVVRSKTSTPLQALVMLNDPQVLEASRVLAEKFVQDKRSDKEKVTEIFRLIVCRIPSRKELNLLQDYLVKERQEFAKNPQRAASFITTGEFRRNEILDKTETAALMQLIHTIYNLDESGNKY
ncbi:MAG TPA: PSD1 and planctomycete cytochrome C domain-containing protein [Chitinophagaceae bacterium]|nr:PSD1 and planctomycete cytochrome C domain-containing protein [Chitinophagaceae bacterium]